MESKKHMLEASVEVKVKRECAGAKRDFPLQHESRIESRICGYVPSDEKLSKEKFEVKTANQIEFFNRRYNFRRSNN
jgi:hypothetical protein